MAARPVRAAPRRRTATQLTDAQIAPDGALVAYVTTPASQDGLHPTSTIWLVTTTGGPPRRLTTSEAVDRSPRWSPDGRYIAAAGNVIDAENPTRPRPALQVWEAGSGKPVGKSLPADWCAGFTFTADSRGLITWQHSGREGWGGTLPEPTAPLVRTFDSP